MANLGLPCGDAPACLGNIAGDCCLSPDGALLELDAWVGGIALACVGDLSTKDCEAAGEGCCGDGIMANLGLPCGDAPAGLCIIAGDCCLRTGTALLELGGMALACVGDLSTKDCEVAGEGCCGDGIMANRGLPTPRGDAAARTDPACFGICCLMKLVVGDWFDGIIASLGDGFLITGGEGMPAGENACLTGAGALCLTAVVGICLGLLPAPAGIRASRCPAPRGACIRGRDTGNRTDETAVRIILTGGPPRRMVAPPRPRPPRMDIPRPRPTGNRGPRARTARSGGGDCSGQARPVPRSPLACAGGGGRASRRAAAGRCSGDT